MRLNSFIKCDSGLTLMAIDDLEEARMKAKTRLKAGTGGKSGGKASGSK